MNNLWKNRQIQQFLKLDFSVLPAIGPAEFLPDLSQGTGIFAGTGPRPLSGRALVNVYKQIIVNYRK